MTSQDEINAMLAVALNDAQLRLATQESCIEMLVEQMEEMSHRMDEVLDEARSARLYYAEQRKRLGLTVNLSEASWVDPGNTG